MDFRYYRIIAGLVLLLSFLAVGIVQAQDENLVCLPDPLELTTAEPSGTIAFDYTGGASGLVYGFSIDVIWDPAVATATTEDFGLPTTGGFAEADLFFVLEIAPGHMRVDAGLGGSEPGIESGPLFEAVFTAADTAPAGSFTVVDLVVVDLRDNLNQPLVDMVPDPGLIRVDASGPTVADVLITDTTLPSVDWTRDGHAYQVSATVFEDDITTLECDLTAFGGTVLGLVDATIDGNLYTWTWAGPSVDLGDGDVIATVTCTNGLAESTSNNDEITADNTPPVAVADLTIAPGHEQIHLAWTEPAPDAGAPLAGVTFRYVTWDSYPHYVGPLPDPPATITEGEQAGLDPVPGAAWDWPIAPRGVYILTAFVTDLVGNTSPASAGVEATNYWLGDSDADGYVTPIPDIDELGDAYGLTMDDDDYNGVVDVGPTMNGSPLGIPNPEADGFQVQFEDLMVVGLNLGEVDPSLKFTPGGLPAMRWEQVDDTSWVLALLEPCAGLKGVNIRADLPDGIICQVQAGTMLDHQSAPVFLQNIPRHGLDTGLAVLGFGQAFTGEGEMLRVNLSEPMPQLTVKLTARDLNNQDLPVSIPQTTGVDVPAVHQLSQNYPNPFNPSTTIAFALPENGSVHLAVYSIDGRLVRTLVDEERSAGHHEVTWFGRDQAGRSVATGSYFFVLRADDFRQVRKMTLVK